MLAFGILSQPVDGETQVGQDIVINDIVKENGVRIERILGQYDAIVECFVVANGPNPPGRYISYFRTNTPKSL